MIQFYAPEIETTGELPEDESGHCVRVLRRKEGDELVCTDGKGHRFRCRIADAHPKHTKVEILAKESIGNHWRGKITLAVAPTKNIDRMEWLLEKSVEIGVDKIVLLHTEHSERKIARIDRLRKIIVSAMKQSLKTVLPELCDVVKLKDFLSSPIEGQRFFGYCSPDEPRRLLAGEIIPESDVCILIGPEGDFSPTEVEMIRNAGYVATTFGESRLRTETAALFAVQTVHVINQLALAKKTK